MRKYSFVNRICVSAATMATALLLPALGAALHAGTDRQGTDRQGIHVQGTDRQGIHVQGTDRQGKELQGKLMQGTSFQGQHVRDDAPTGWRDGLHDGLRDGLRDGWRARSPLCDVMPGLPGDHDLRLYPDHDITTAWPWVRDWHILCRFVPPGAGRQDRPDHAVKFARARIPGHNPGLAPKRA